MLNMGLLSKYARKRTGQVPAQTMTIDLHATRQIFGRNQALALHCWCKREFFHGTWPLR